MELDPLAQDLLLNNFLSLGDSKIRLQNNITTKVAIDLASVGVLAGDATTDEFWIPSPLIRAVIWSSLSIDEPKVPPPIDKGMLDVVTAIKIGLPLFNRETMIRAPMTAFKQNRDTGTVVKFQDPVPNEHVYHVELLMLLRKWLKDIHKWEVDSEVNSGRDSCDIVIARGEEFRYVLEIVAHTTPKVGKESLKAHYGRAASYQATLVANEAWVINFTTRPPSKGYLWPDEETQELVYAIHVYHDLDWTEARVVTSPEDKVGTLIKLGG